MLICTLMCALILLHVDAYIDPSAPAYVGACITRHQLSVALALAWRFFLKVVLVIIFIFQLVSVRF